MNAFGVAGIVYFKSGRIFRIVVLKFLKKLCVMSVNIVLLGLYTTNRIGNVPLGVRDDTRARLGKSNGRIFETTIQ